MSAGDVTATLDDALAVAGVEQVMVHHRPRLLSDNGSCYISHELAEYLQEKRMDHTRGKIERYHRTMKNVVKLQNYYQSEVLEREIARFVDYYNNKRVHESLGNVTPADVFCGRYRQILEARRLLKKQT